MSAIKEIYSATDSGRASKIARDDAEKKKFCLLYTSDAADE